MDARELDRLGDEIAELSVHLEAATARLLDLIREFDAWGVGLRSRHTGQFADLGVGQLSAGESL